MVTFTVPAPLRSLMRSRQRVLYNALFRASSEAMKKLAADEKWIGGDLPGFFGVLHTWGRTLQYHPHIHYVVTGGAISKETGRWRPSGTAFFLPNRALSMICRAKFREAMARAGLIDQIPAEVWQTPWNVNIQPVGSSEQSIGYLAPYVFKVAITNSRILRVEDRKVVFRYKKQKSARWRSLSLDVLEFMRRFLQHVLPAGFMKIRYFGFLHPGSSFSLEKVRALIEWTCGVDGSVQTAETTGMLKPFCPKCGGAMHYLYSIFPHQMTQAFLPAPSKARMAGNSG